MNSAGRPDRSGLASWSARQDGRSLLISCAALTFSAALTLVTAPFPNASSHLAVRWFVIIATAVVGVWGLSRPSHGDPLRALAIVSIVAAATVSAFTYDSMAMRWVCVVGIVTLPMLTLILVSSRWSVLTASAGWVGQVLVVISTDPTLSDLAMSAMVLLVVMAICTGYPALLLHRSHAARGAAEAAKAAAEHMATHDSLTGLLNRRGLQDRLPKLASGLGRDISVLAVAVLDIDHFKRVNDSFGRDVGDAALVAVAHSIRGEVREEDICARLGGEEFVVVMTCPDVTAARRAAERLRQRVSATRAVGVPQMTVSVGISCAAAGVVAGAADAAVSQLLTSADRALYEAKSAGRDRVVMATSGL